MPGKTVVAAAEREPRGTTAVARTASRNAPRTAARISSRTSTRTTGRSDRSGPDGPRLDEGRIIASSGLKGFTSWHSDATLHQNMRSNAKPQPVVKRFCTLRPLSCYVPTEGSELSRSQSSGTTLRVADRAVALVMERTGLE